MGKDIGGWQRGLAIYAATLAMALAGAWVIPTSGLDTKKGMVKRNATPAL